MLPEKMNSTQNTNQSPAVVGAAGSRVESNAGLVLASMCETYTSLQNLSQSPETQSIARTLWDMGTIMEIVGDHVSVKGGFGKQEEVSSQVKEDVLSVLGIQKTAHDTPQIDATESPMSTYVLMCLCAMKTGTWEMKTLDTPQTKNLTNALRQMGATIKEKNNLPGLTITGGNLRGDTLELHDLNDEVIVPALMMIAPGIPGGLEIHLKHKPQTISEIQIVINSIVAFGGNVRKDISVLPDGGAKFVIEYRPMVSPIVLEIESDLPEIMKQCAEHIIRGQSVRAVNLPAIHMTTQDDMAVFGLVEDMGCDVQYHASGHEIIMHPAEKLKSVTGEIIDVSLIPESFPAIMILAGSIVGMTRIEGIKSVEARSPGLVREYKNLIESMGRNVDMGDDFIQVNL